MNRRKHINIQLFPSFPNKLNKIAKNTFEKSNNWSFDELNFEWGFDALIVVSNNVVVTKYAIVSNIIANSTPKAKWTTWTPLKHWRLGTI